MSDLIASARSMTSYSDNQFVAVGFPKGGLTPATITAMVGFSQGEGLQMNPMVTAALDKIKGATSATITGLPAGAASALANAGITTANVLTSSNVTATVSSIETALAADGIGLDTATKNSLTSTIGTASKLQSLSGKLMAGGPAAFMQKFNAARGHIADTIELKKVTAFTANQSLDSFGSGMKKMSSLSSNGLGGVMGNMAAAGAAMAAAGPLFDLSDAANLGSPVGLINKLSSSKLANSTGINAALTKAGVKLDDLSNPANADKISKVMGSITDPAAIKDIAGQFGITPPGGLPDVGKQSFASLAAANPFAGVPGYAGADSSLTTGAAGALLGGAPAPIQPAPLPIQPSPVEGSSNPAKWDLLNDLATPAPTNSKQARIDTIVKQLTDTGTELNDLTPVLNKIFTDFNTAANALDVSKAGVEAEWTALKAEYNNAAKALFATAIDKSNEINSLVTQLPRSSPERSKWSNTLIPSFNRLFEGFVATKDINERLKKEISAKIKAAGGS